MTNSLPLRAWNTAVLALLLVVGCGRTSTPTNVAGVRQHTGDLGVVTLDSTHSEPYLVRFLNDDGSVWWEGDPFADGAMRPPGFAPVGWHGDYHVLALRIQERQGDDLLVVVNEDDGLVKRLDPASTGLAMRTWQEFVSQQMVEATHDRPQNLLASPDDDAAVVGPMNGPYVGRSATGDWIELCPFPDNEEGTECGWARWRDASGGLIVSFLVG